MDQDRYEFDMDGMCNKRLVDAKSKHRLLFTYDDEHTMVIDHEDGDGYLVESFIVNLDEKADRSVPMSDELAEAFKLS